MKNKVLYVEDEENLGSIVKETLEFKGYEVLYLKHGISILDKIKDFQPDICVLDIMLPQIDGLTLGTTIKQNYPTLPIIFLTAKGQTKDVLDGFAAGATDYIKKPFSLEELMVRIDTQINIASSSNLQKVQPSNKKEYKLGQFSYYPDKLELHGDSIISLSNREAEILNFFCQNINESINRKDLLLNVWGDDSFFNSRNLDVYIKKLRIYFGEGKGVNIITLKGKGYIFSVD